MKTISNLSESPIYKNLCSTTGKETHIQEVESSNPGILFAYSQIKLYPNRVIFMLQIGKTQMRFEQYKMAVFLKDK